MRLNFRSKTSVYFSIIAAVTVLCWSPLNAQELTEQIRLNQIGFYPHAPKKAVVMSDQGGSFHVITPDMQDTVYTGTLGSPRNSPFSPKVSRIADFSDVITPGIYVMDVPGLGYSHEFEISNRVLKGVADASLKAYYFMRSSTALTEAYAGPWARAAGTPDTQVSVHASAATEARPEGTIISSPKGWYDAGDYNKYIVNSGISTATLLSLYEDFPAYTDTIDTHIPESGNDLPDLLDEILWNLRWMLTMQDPNDGGVYHKLTFASFSGKVMPNQATATRYVVQKSTPATLDFAAVMAQAARIFDDFEQQLPGLADSCLTAAESAWQWAQQHRSRYYNQGQLNSQYNPDINTGEYGDSDASDEFIWAAAELYITTGDDSYWEAEPIDEVGNFNLPWWGGVKGLGYYSLLRNEDQLTSIAEPHMDDIRNSLLGYAGWIIDGASESSYDTPFGNHTYDFGWGSNSGAGNETVALINAYNITNDQQYLDAALANVDYLLGRNGTGYSFVTGYGDKTPMNPHHRPSAADGVRDPVPGLVVGGPNPAQQDGCNYPSDEPDESYVDSWCSYASNEITINWNAPMVYAAQALEMYAGEVGWTPIAKERTLPQKFVLEQNYPNPFNPATTIRYQLPQTAHVNLTVYNMLGREVTTLVDQRQTVGRHEVSFDASALSSGVYLYRIETGSFVQSRKMMLVK